MSKLYFVSLFFELVGTMVRWLLCLPINLIRGKRMPTVNEIWNGAKNYNSADALFYMASNKLVGIIFMILLFMMLNLID